MDRKIYVVIMAAGSGSRMGAAVPKQFLPLKGRPVLSRTIEKFARILPHARIVTVLPKDSIPFWKGWCVDNNFHYPQIIVEGGITRFHSVRNALARIPEGAVVAVHDGVRPLFTEDLISRMTVAMEDTRAVIPVMPMVDTLKVLRKTSSGYEAVPGANADRSMIFGAQTPQMFLSEDLKEAYSLAYDTAFTDDASVAEAKQIPLTFVEGERFNIKITTPQDMELAEAILAVRGEI